MSSTYNLPYTTAAAITPGDASTHNYVAFMVTVAGDVKVRDSEGNDTVIGCAVGTIVPLKIVRVFATGTTATGITGFN